MSNNEEDDIVDKTDEKDIEIVAGDGSRTCIFSCI